MESSTDSVRAICPVCERRGWGGFAGAFYTYESLGLPQTPEQEERQGRWEYLPVTRRTKKQGGNVSRVGLWEVPIGWPIRPRCPSGHMLRPLNKDDVERVLFGATGGKVRLPE